MNVVPIQQESRVSTEDAGCSSPCSRFCREIWRRMQMEFVVEWPLLKTRWKTILFGAVFQYVHGIFTQLEHRLHEPQEVPLGDLGFEALPELDDSKSWVSESVFWFMFISFLLWTLSPFFVAKKRFYTVLLFSRILMVVVVCQSLRIISFLSTQLPAPHYHCRKGEPTAKRDWPEHWWSHVLMNPTRQATGGCGDLIFSSHTTFVLVGVLSYTTYGGYFVIKALGWVLAGILSLLIIASRKHYTVDVIVAWYTVPLVFYTMHRRWTTHRDMRDETDSIQGEGDTDLEIGVQDNSKTQKSNRPVWPNTLYNTSSALGNGAVVGDNGPSRPQPSQAAKPPPRAHGLLGKDQRSRPNHGFVPVMSTQLDDMPVVQTSFRGRPTDEIHKGDKNIDGTPRSTER